MIKCMRLERSNQHDKSARPSKSYKNPNLKRIFCAYVRTAQQNQSCTFVCPSPLSKYKTLICLTGEEKQFPSSHLFLPAVHDWREKEILAREGGRDPRGKKKSPHPPPVIFPSLYIPFFLPPSSSGRGGRAAAENDVFSPPPSFLFTAPQKIPRVRREKGGGGFVFRGGV